MDPLHTAEQIIALKKADLELRDSLLKEGQLNDGYHPEMEALHHRNAEALEAIIDAIGYPTIDKVGREASEAAWLVIQHAIGRPDFMRKCASLLERAVREDKADPILLAYLSDRIAVFEGRPQRYGTQFDWDEQGAMSPQPCDDPAKVDRRRRSLGLNTLAEQTEKMRARVKQENQSPPADPHHRKQQYDAWRRQVGWIKD